MDADTAQKEAQRFTSTDTRQFIIALAVSLFYGFGVIHFITGLLNQVILFPFAAIFIFIILLLSIKIYLSNWSTLSPPRRRTRVKGLVVLLILIVISSILAGPPFIPYTYGFREKMRLQADFKNLEAWRQVLVKAGKGHERYPMVDRIQWPEHVKKLDPKDVYISEDGQLRLIWGSGLVGHWGMVIGSPGKGSDQDFFELPLNQNACIWHSRY